MEQRKGDEDNDEQREETVQEKIDRLGKEVQDMQKADQWMRSSCPPGIIPGPLLIGKGGLETSVVRSVYYLKPVIENNHECPPDIMRLYASFLIDISSTYYPDCVIFPSGDNNWPEALFWYRRAIAQLTDAEAIPFVESYESTIRELCACCYKPLITDKPKCCTECKAVYYCSRECQ
eukprot:CAMPEP_0178691580 /NCGR_PEP_ID=MMETSP0699-20121125/6722_1 /TAXON_ID=265572 /ORGANISM="Extubocellulus spinifer, Strain CCMP396" /LENGTH=176 /DNA_ID=CAMNT_0020336869 /DNA_START=72 /DNA_END=600 /DNA_ORIENTATION=-